MPTMSNEIIADMAQHIQKLGGDFSAWCAGTAPDVHNPLFDADRLEGSDDTLIYREAYTPTSARAVRDFFVAEHGTGCGNCEAGQEGKLVYVRRKHLRESR